MTTTYSAVFLQTDRPQPMYVINVNRVYREIFHASPGENAGLNDEFKAKFLAWLKADQLNTLRGFEDGYELDICIGCTHFIDDLYQTVGRERLMIFKHDYKYHWRLHNDIQYSSLQTLERGKELLIAMPFPFYGDKHPEMDAVLARCLELGIPVHIDGAWIGCSRDISFDFAHPAIASFAISLSKGFGIGGNRVGMRFTRRRQPGPITIMNDFNMTCQSLTHIGIHFIDRLGANYFWKKYADAYAKICRDFNLKPTKAIHLAQSERGPVGLRLLLRHLADK
jgi:hypothetical protein